MGCVALWEIQTQDSLCGFAMPRMGFAKAMVLNLVNASALSGRSAEHVMHIVYPRLNCVVVSQAACFYALLQHDALLLL